MKKTIYTFSIVHKNNLIPIEANSLQEALENFMGDYDQEDFNAIEDIQKSYVVETPCEDFNLSEELYSSFEDIGESFYHDDVNGQERLEKILLDTGFKDK